MYALVLIHISLSLRSNKRTPPIVSSSMLKTPLTGVDELTTLVLNFEEAHTQGIATCNVSHDPLLHSHLIQHRFFLSQMSVRTHPTHTTLVQGEKGDLTVSWGPHRPESFTIRLRKDEASLQEPQETKCDIPGHGMFWEADACARALRDGKKEAELCPLCELASLIVMRRCTLMHSRAFHSYYTAHDGNHGWRASACRLSLSREARGCKAGRLKAAVVGLTTSITSASKGDYRIALGFEACAELQL